jgi:GT2 family glycosyltransferase
MSIGVVVVAYHDMSDLRGFLESFQSFRSQVETSLVISLVDTNEAECRIVDNLITKYCSGQVQWRSFSENIGYARACNDAVAQWVDDPEITTYALFNADTELRSGVLDGCNELLWSDPTYGIVGPRQVDRSGFLTHSGIVGPPPRFRSWKDSGRDGRWSDTLTDAWSVVGSAYFVKAPVWWELAHCPIYREVDPTSEGAFLVTDLYFEDEWCSRHAVAHGYKVVFAGGFTMMHTQGGASPDRTQVIQKMKKSQVIYENACAVHEIVSGK